jgi:hypothetical protein
MLPGHAQGPREKNDAGQLGGIPSLRHLMEEIASADEIKL